MSSEPFSLSKKWPHVLFLVVALVIAGLWINEHLAFSTPFLICASVLSVAIPIVKFLRRRLSKEEESKIDAAINRLIDFLLNRKVLMILCVLIGLIVMFVSSFTIYKSDFGDEPSVRSGTTKESLQANEYVDVKGEKHTFIKFISPLGKEYAAQVEGYGVQTFMIYPWHSAKPKFSASPKLFIGLSGGPSLYAGTSLVVVYNKQEMTIERGDTLSIIIGSEQEISPKEKGILKEYLQANVKEPEYITQMLTGWNSQVTRSAELHPGDTIEIKLIRTDGTQFMPAEKIKISKDPFQYILL